MNSILKLRLLTNTRFANVLQSRHSSFKSSLLVSQLGEVKVKYEETNDPVDWKYVERLLPPKVVPPPALKAEYPSNWKPQSPESLELPYFVRRTKNHMLPVYMKLTHRGSRRLTYVKKIQGDIWLLANEIREFLQKDEMKPIRWQVNEFVGYICIHGDYVNAIKYWLLKKSF